MNRCGECGLFCSCGAMWPVGMCLPRGDKLILPSDECCVMWEADWRGVDQSDGVAEKTAEDERAGYETFDGVYGEGALGAADPVGAEDVRKPEFPRSAGILPGPRLKQPELF